MIPESPAPPPIQLNGRTLASLREALRLAGYSQERVAALLGPKPPFPETRLAVYLRRLPMSEPLATLIRLFGLGVAVRTGDAERALAPADLDSLLDTGVLEARDGDIAAAFALTPYEGLLLAHDRGETWGDAPPWHVPGVVPASRTLAALTFRRPVRVALDVGTGCGVQALLAARHAQHVVATDLNERALRFTAVNAELNELHNVECRYGSLFDPVDGEQFDLVVSNPPFVLSPESGLLFRDSGLTSDELSRRVLTEAPGFLTDQGYAIALCSWVSSSESDWAERPRSWLAGVGCDAVLLHFTTDDPLSYAAKWTTDLDHWLEHYRALGLERISLGAAVLRRAEGSGNVIAMQSTSAPGRSSGEQILRIFSAHDDLARAQDETSLLGATFELVDHGLAQRARYRAGAYVVDTTVLSLTGALDARVDTDAIHVLARLDGSTRLRDVIRRAAAETRLEHARLEQAALATVRRLYERGFLVRRESA